MKTKQKCKHDKFYTIFLGIVFLVLIIVGVAVSLPATLTYQIGFNNGEEARDCYRGYNLEVYCEYKNYTYHPKECFK